LSLTVFLVLPHCAVSFGRGLGMHGLHHWNVLQLDRCGPCCYAFASSLVVLLVQVMGGVFLFQRVAVVMVFTFVLLCVRLDGRGGGRMGDAESSSRHGARRVATVQTIGRRDVGVGTMVRDVGLLGLAFKGYLSRYSFRV
jgi:hypothetical protein